MAKAMSSPRASGPYLLHFYGWNHSAQEDFKGPKPSGPGLPTTKKTQSSLSYSQDLGSAGY